MNSLSLSVHDLVPVRQGQSSAQAVASTVALAQRADELGLTRYWLAEHHNVASFASTSPPALLGALAARTERIRVGAGGVMLPNHAPLVVAEQFAVLEALAPGRIDLGIGRAPGSDPVVSAVLRAGGDEHDFPADIGQVDALLSRTGLALPSGSALPYIVRATPEPSSRPTLWLLGSSEYSADLAARLGLGYVFAHLSPATTDRAMQIYHERFQPSRSLDAPHAVISVGVVAADTDSQAEELALPYLQQLSVLLGGGPVGPLRTVESARGARTTGRQQQVIDMMRASWFVGRPDAVADDLSTFAARFAVKEIMVMPAAGAYDQDPLDRVPAREHTLELLAARLPQRTLSAV